MVTGPGSGLTTAWARAGKHGTAGDPYLAHPLGAPYRQDDVSHGPFAPAQEVLIAPEVDEDEISDVANSIDFGRTVPKRLAATLQQTVDKRPGRDGLAGLGLSDPTQQPQLVPVVSVVTQREAVETGGEVDRRTMSFGHGRDPRRQAQV